MYSVLHTKKPKCNKTLESGIFNLPGQILEAFIALYQERKMRVVNQAMMNQVFDVTDEIELSREAIEIPLGLEGEGQVIKLPDGRFEITLPDTEDLTSFLDNLVEKLKAAGLQF